MSNTVIDSKSESHNFGFWPAKEKVKTTISLVSMPGGKFGLSYNSVFSGVKGGHVSGGPYDVSGNEDLTVHDSPKVALKISDYNKTASSITMTVMITVDIPVIGTETIYDETLSGPYTSNPGWDNVMNHLSNELSKQKQHAHAEV